MEQLALHQNKHKHEDISDQKKCRAPTSQDSQQRKRPVLTRLASLTDNEKYALTSLLIDSTDVQPKVLTKELLLTTPFPPSNNASQTTPQFRDSPLRKGKRRRNSRQYTGLWKASDVGILHKVIRKGSSLFQKRDSRTKLGGESEIFPAQSTVLHHNDELGERGSETPHDTRDQTNISIISSDSDTFSRTSIKTDMSQCKARHESDDSSSVSSVSSWVDAPAEHYDSWQLLNDEYAEDFGFGYKPDVGNVDEGSRRSFEILGTSPDDLSAQPHVLSPPLMESLLSFVPDSLSCENWWLKYSLIRDGACLETFRNYTKAAQNTVIAIQTTSGDVFGCFTTSPWQIQRGYYGGGEAFVWKMRYNRFLKCCSLYDQGTMESIIDIFTYSGLNNSVQLCTSEFLAVGGGEVESGLAHDDDLLKQMLSCNQKRDLGFAIALHDDLQRGTSSPSSTFCNPKLTRDNDGIFEISNLEVWTFTPCTTVHDAEQLEMRKYFLYEKFHDTNVSSMASIASTESPTSPNSSQRMFYRRLGENHDDLQRDRKSVV